MAQLQAAFDLGVRKVRRLVTSSPGATPSYTEGGRWVLDNDPWAPSWTAGFLTGMLWIAAERTGEEWFRTQAESYSLALESRKSDPTTHDIGFLFSPSWGRWRELDDSDHVRSVIIEAGRTMAARFNSAGGYLSSWVDPGSTFIDIMMNVDIIFEAAEISGDANLHDIALRHAATSRRHLVRGDATTIHEGWFDPTTGEFARSATHQGVRADSSWVRGQAWAIYGFATTFARTRDERFLETSISLARSFIERSRGELPPNDWEEHAPVHRVESSAACIAAAGLIKLAPHAGDEGDEFLAHATLILQQLIEPEYLAYEDDWDGIVKHATYHRTAGLGIDESVMWGEYFFLEALDLLLSARGH